VTDGVTGRTAGQPPRRLLPRTARLLSQRDFRRVYSRGRRLHGRWLVAVALFARDGQGPRLGLSVSKEHGGAVRRNKIKRLLREAFRLERPALPPRLELVLIPRVQPGRLELPVLRAELLQLVRQLPQGAGDRRRRETP